MSVLIWMLAMLLVVAGIAGLVLPALPGPALLFAGLLVAAWAEGFMHVGATTLVVLGVMAAIASLADFVAGAFGARDGAPRSDSSSGRPPSWRSALRWWGCSWRCGFFEVGRG